MSRGASFTPWPALHVSNWVLRPSRLLHCRIFRLLRFVSVQRKEIMLKISSGDDYAAYMTAELLVPDLVMGRRRCLAGAPVVKRHRLST